MEDMEDFPAPNLKRVIVWYHYCRHKAVSFPEGWEIQNTRSF